jgi:2,4-dienoyl-CoA reductase-like NADH-dependent reductase (Old Yellow Enzyme family)
MSNLFTPITLGSVTTPNRIIMAPLTRSRATRDYGPTPMMADYYAQRASAGLIISEAIGVSRQGNGFTYTPGLWTKEQIAAWKPITRAIHARSGRIIAQLGHTGRAGHPTVIGEQPVSASATISPVDAWTYDGPQPAHRARELKIDEIAGIVAHFAQAARNAIIAGFDGVQIHAANGMLIDQFLRNRSNARNDGYGGSVENRIRFLNEVTRAVAGAIGAARTSVRLSPNGETWGVDDSDPTPLFTAAAAMLDEIGIAFLELKEHRPDGSFAATDVPRQSPMIRPLFKGPLVLNGDYDLDRARVDLDSGLADAISFGRPFIANPDLVERLRAGAPIAPADAATFYTQGVEGYLDYPTLLDSKAAA